MFNMCSKFGFFRFMPDGRTDGTHLYIPRQLRWVGDKNLLEQDWLARCQYNVIWWGVMLIWGMVLQCAVTFKPSLIIGQYRRSRILFSYKSMRNDVKPIHSVQIVKRERERKGLYVQSTQIGYIRTSKAWKKEK